MHGIVQDVRAAEAGDAGQHVKIQQPAVQACSGAPPAVGDYAAQAMAQARWESQVDFPFEFQYRAELEKRAGGNPSWNTGVDYAHQLAISSDSAEGPLGRQRLLVALQLRDWRDRDRATSNTAPQGKVRRDHAGSQTLVERAGEVIRQTLNSSVLTYASA